MNATVADLLGAAQAMTDKRTAERDQARRIAASLEADLARILAAFDDAYRDALWTAPSMIRDAVEAARERGGS